MSEFTKEYKEHIQKEIDIQKKILIDKGWQPKELSSTLQKYLDDYNATGPSMYGYHAFYSPDGNIVVMTVSCYEEDWSEEEYELNHNRAYWYVINTENDLFSEGGLVGFIVDTWTGNISRIF